MNGDTLNRISGQNISGFSLVKYPFLGLKRVIVHFSSGRAIEFKAQEVKLGSDEAHTIEVRECPGVAGIERVNADWIVGQIQVVKRNDWLEPVAEDVETVGINPRVHAWGAIGTAPIGASHTLVVTCAVIFTSDLRDRQAMIYLADYPGLVVFTTDAREISALGQAYNGAAQTYHAV